MKIIIIILHDFRLTDKNFFINKFNCTSVSRFCQSFPSRKCSNQRQAGKILRACGIPSSFATCSED
ncbi:hypothetical protein A2768_00665 [Candidatus Roizmanbacteria bacterium RIFCSPHIGHO2_01_FULL_37_16]|nr:MAG: hypothetical protein A2768_00665 [Candidatus Roizmanbacteria bacterium RIFCSPHIGHO2_01_FULL_37_16]OGK26828.1 MAG: hypothetical protein A3D76_05080 [Candidatus Roizmanbacteria bacterium RIFCSPHIGHO2_02_FULL_37_9b]